MPPNHEMVRHLGSPATPAPERIPAEAFEELGRRLAGLISCDELLSPEEAAKLLGIPVARFRDIEPVYLHRGLRFLDVSTRKDGKRPDRRYSKMSLLGLTRTLYEEAAADREQAAS